MAGYASDSAEDSKGREVEIWAFALPGRYEAVYFIPSVWLRIILHGDESLVVASTTQDKGEYRFRHCVVASTWAFEAQGPGSIPGGGAIAPQ